MNEKYYSQSNQDKFIDCFFQKKENGFFLDIGAHDGVTFSNTLFLEKNRNWEGICFEPIPEVFGELDGNRECIKYNACVSEKDGEEIFLRCQGYCEMLSGLKRNYNSESMARLKREMLQYGGECNEIKVKTLNINNVLRENNINCIDYCSIDTEGSELDILRTIDFNEIIIKVFSIEKNSDRIVIKNFLQEKGYALLPAIGVDDFFVKKNQFNRMSVLKYQIFLGLKRLKIKLDSLYKQ